LKRRLGGLGLGAVNSQKYRHKKKIQENFNFLDLTLKTYFDLLISHSPKNNRQRANIMSSNAMLKILNSQALLRYEKQTQFHHYSLRLLLSELQYLLGQIILDRFCRHL